MMAIKRGFFRTIGAPGISFLALTAALVLTGPQAAWAKKPHASANAVDPTDITACGTYSASNTIYLLTANISTTSTGTCITLSGDDTTLALQGFNITYTGVGTQTGDGILIKSTANEDVIEGGGSEVSGFAVGVLDQGANTAGDDMITVGNGIGLELNGTSTGTEIWTNIDSSSNTAQGIFINRCTDECGVSDFFVSDNGGDGVLVTGSEGPRLSVFSAEGNGGAGVHVGCTSTNSNCSGHANSEVKIGDAPEGAGGPDTPGVTGNAGDGIFLDQSEATVKDQVYLIFAGGNGVSSGYDLHDASSTCGNNHWVTNDYDTAQAAGVSNPACIPLTPF